MGDVDRASAAVSRPWSGGMDRTRDRRAEHRRLAVQLASVRFHAGLGLRSRRRRCRRHGAKKSCDAKAGRRGAMNRIDLPSHPRILVVALRRLGDVLLTTPLIRSLRHAWPDATIETLAFADTAGILKGNPDLNGVVVMPSRPTIGQGLALAARLWRRYDLAISTQSGDRPTFFASIAGRVRVGPFEPNFSGRLKHLVFHRSTPYEPGVHRVEEILRFADLLGIARVPDLVAPHSADASGMTAGPYAVIHAAPMFRYKQWTKQGWRELAAACRRYDGVSKVVAASPINAIFSRNTRPTT